ncbi:transposase domain-containing protein, partial [Burkholderia ubonensis]|uniref:transposase domain-containing protein n=1 Tax=Burkholderia ubonensis TaxID=101571 RepID=UPI000B32634E
REIPPRPSRNLQKTPRIPINFRARAHLYSLVQTCIANHIDVYRYLVDLFKALPHAKTAEDYDALLPWKLGRRPPEKNL